MSGCLSPAVGASPSSRQDAPPYSGKPKARFERSRARLGAVQALALTGGLSGPKFGPRVLFRFVSAVELSS